jgi:hypothetical protein
MSELSTPTPLTKSEVVDHLAQGACIQPDRHGAAVIIIVGRCADEWEELRRDGWLSKTISGTLVLSERGAAAVGRTEAHR